MCTKCVILQVKNSRANALPPGMSADMVAKPVPKEMSKSAKKNAARKAKRAAEQNAELDAVGGDLSALQLAQEAAKMKAGAAGPAPAPAAAVSSCALFLWHHLIIQFLWQDPAKKIKNLKKKIKQIEELQVCFLHSFVVTRLCSLVV